MRYSKYSSLQSCKFPRSRVKGSQLPKAFLGGMFSDGKTTTKGANAAGIAGMAGDAIGEIDGMDGKMSVGGGLASGALKGVAAGAAFGPWGAAAGAVIGGVTGVLKAKKQQKEFEEARIAQEKANRLANAMQSKQNINKFPVNGLADSTFLAGYGAEIPAQSPDFLAEGGEVIQYEENNVPKTDQHGTIIPMNSNTGVFTGDSHEDASEGIGVIPESDAKVYSDRLYVDDELLLQINKI